jgi:cephalosporin-C deacetylase
MPDEEIRRFWEGTRAALDAVPMDARVEAWDPPGDPLQTAAYVNAYTPELREGVARGRVGDSGVSYARVTLTSFGGVRIRGWYLVPGGTPPAGGWPVLLTVPGYSETIGAFAQTLVRFGYALLMLFPRSQGESRAEWQIEHGTKLTYHLSDRDRYYYRGAYMDCVRGLDFLCGRPEVDGGRVGMFGISQGGGLTLATASLDERIRAAVAWIPFLCNYPVAVDVPSLPYRELGEYLAAHPEERGAVLETLRWYDPLNLVDGIAAPMLVSIGGLDVVCPEATVMPVFARIRSRKALLYLPELAHGYSVDYAVETKGWLDRFLG